MTQEILAKMISEVMDDVYKELTSCISKTIAGLSLAYPHVWRPALAGAIVRVAFHVIGMTLPDNIDPETATAKTREIMHRLVDELEQKKVDKPN